MSFITDRNSFVRQCLPPPWRSTTEGTHPFEALTATLTDPLFDTFDEEIKYRDRTLIEMQRITQAGRLQDIFRRTMGIDDTGATWKVGRPYFYNTAPDPRTNEYQNLPTALMSAHYEHLRVRRIESLNLGYIGTTIYICLLYTSPSPRDS